MATVVWPIIVQTWEKIIIISPNEFCSNTFAKHIGWMSSLQAILDQ